MKFKIQIAALLISQAAWSYSILMPSHSLMTPENTGKTFGINASLSYKQMEGYRLLDSVGYDSITTHSKTNEIRHSLGADVVLGVYRFIDLYHRWMFAENNGLFNLKNAGIKFQILGKSLTDADIGNISLSASVWYWETEDEEKDTRGRAAGSLAEALSGALLSAMTLGLYSGPTDVALIKHEQYTTSASVLSGYRYQKNLQWTGGYTFNRTKVNGFHKSFDGNGTSFAENIRQHIVHLGWGYFKEQQNSDPENKTVSRLVFQLEVSGSRMETTLKNFYSANAGASIGIAI